MKQLLIFILGLFLFFTADSQTYTQRRIQMTAGVGGFYEWLPTGYSSAKKYPVFLFLHGLGEQGNGTSDLYLINRNGLPGLINNYGFPYEAVVIAPQFGGWPTGSQVENVMNYVLANYSIDTNRIYVTGLSMGGGATWDYASISRRPAAIVPVCGASSWNSSGVANMKANKVAIWAFHAQDDGVVSVSNTNGWISNLNSAGIDPVASKTIFPTGGHNIWGTVNDYSYIVPGTGKNIYEWMMQFSKSTAPVTPPVVTPPPGSGATIKVVAGQPAFGEYTADSRYLINQDRGWIIDMEGIWGPNSYVVTGTSNPQLYRAERWGTFEYGFPVANGLYNVKLHFAEIYINTVGRRLFNVDIENTRVLSNFDMRAVAPRFTALVRSYDTQVSDGVLNIKFSSSVSDAKIAAIEIAPASAPAYYKLITVDYVDSLTGNIIKSRIDTFFTPTNVIVKK
jgi:dipeptidyl aminopeptidase/acylaminoacyl peptidase